MFRKPSTKRKIDETQSPKPIETGKYIIDKKTTLNDIFGFPKITQIFVQGKINITLLALLPLSINSITFQDDIDILDKLAALTRKITALTFNFAIDTSIADELAKTIPYSVKSINLNFKSPQAIAWLPYLDIKYNEPLKDIPQKKEKNAATTNDTDKNLYSSTLLAAKIFSTIANSSHHKNSNNNNYNKNPIPEKTLFQSSNAAIPIANPQPINANSQPQIVPKKMTFAEESVKLTQGLSHLMEKKDLLKNTVERLEFISDKIRLLQKRQAAEKRIASDYKSPEDRDQNDMPDLSRMGLKSNL